MGQSRPSRTVIAAMADPGNMEEAQDFVMAMLREMGICVPIRTILIRKGYFIGHKYRLHDGGYALWLIEKKVIEVYDRKEKLLRAVSLEEISKKSAA